MANGSKFLVGKAGIFDVTDGFEYTFGAFMGCFRTEIESANSRFVFYLFQTGQYRNYISNLVAGSSINNLRPSSIESLEFQFPEMPEQTAIATALSDMDAEVSKLESRRDKIGVLKQAMMQELLTGKTRLVDVSASIDSLHVVADVVVASGQARTSRSHNWQINEAVVFAMLVKTFGSEKYPLGRKRCTKLSYLLHRHVERAADGYLKKAAGPYNPAVKYKGPESIAEKNGYVRRHSTGRLSGFVAVTRPSSAAMARTWGLVRSPRGKRLWASWSWRRP